MQSPKKPVLTRSRRSNAESLVNIYRVAPIDIVPTPDKSIMGRLDKILRSVGASGSVSVRARMITAVSNTKFKTVRGLPISMIGLHGKDELLVVGPSWALERLAEGEQPDAPAKQSDRLDDRKTIENEIDLLSQVKTLLAEAGGAASPGMVPADTCDTLAQAVIAEKKLCALFRANIGIIRDYFTTNEVDDFVREMTAEATELLAQVSPPGLDNGGGEYPVWWECWEKDYLPDPGTALITRSGRHVTAYAVRGKEEAKQQPRTNDLTGYLAPKNSITA